MAALVLSSWGPPRPSCLTAWSLPRDELTIGTDLDLEDLAQGGLGGEAEPAVGAEIAHRVGDQVALVDLHPAQHVRAVAEDERRSGVDDGVSKGGKVAAILAEEQLGALRDVLGLVPSAPPWNETTTMSAFFFASMTRRRASSSSLMLGIPRLCPKPIKATFLPLESRYAVVASGSSVPANLMPCLRTRCVSRASSKPKSPGVIISDAHHVETGFLQILAVTRRRAKRKTPRRSGRAFARRAAIDERAFEIAKRDVRGGEDRRHFFKKIGPVIRRHPRFVRERRRHHYVAHRPRS